MDHVLALSSDLLRLLSPLIAQGAHGRPPAIPGPGRGSYSGHGIDLGPLNVRTLDPEPAVVAALRAKLCSSEIARRWA